MTDQQAKNLTTEVFSLIRQSTSTEALKRIIDEQPALSAYRMNLDTYPKIEFKISPEEVNALMDKEAEGPFAASIAAQLTDPLAKLLYAVLWKNGDLPKIEHIIKGIRESPVKNELPDKALVFYQFGRYLTKRPGQPIIDQHVIRAYGVYVSESEEAIARHRKLSTLGKAHKRLIARYINWMASDEIQPELTAIADYAYHVDQVLFALGKVIKTRKRGGGKTSQT